MGRRWFHSRWSALVIGLAAGAIVGFAVYWGSRLHDAGLYTLCGTVAGGIAALVFWGFARRARLTELKLSIPYLTDVTFAVTPTNEAVAWQLFVQSATRISAQPMTEGTGIVRESLDSSTSCSGPYARSCSTPGRPPAVAAASRPSKTWRSAC
ncbi:hypothetical protein [Actinoplanes sp. NPDC051411]|jgi:hypothetical protein|uniref:hypothetical protein n=1 Tax=Actinoplanes sp. NPDC051411 TaxID=3155522 RepID=UPI00342A0EA6